MKTNLEILKDTKRAEYDKRFDKDMAEKAPYSQNISEDIEFFRVDKVIGSFEALENEYAQRRLRPATLYELCEYDIKYPKLIDEKTSVSTHWKDGDRWCFVRLSYWQLDNTRTAMVTDNPYGFKHDACFAGVRINKTA